MGRYSRKHMIEFAKFAKSYQSPRKVEDAYDEYLKGMRHAKTKEDTLYMKISRSNIVYLDGKTIKDRYNKEEISGIVPLLSGTKVGIVDWNRKLGILSLKTI